MKILFLGDAHSIHFIRWVRFFAAWGHEVFAWSAEPPKEEIPGYRRLFPRLPGRVFGYPSLVSPLKNQMAKLGPDLVNAHFVPNYGFIGALAGAHPLAITTWGSDVLISPQKSFLHKARARWTLSKAGLVTADSRSAAVEVLYLGVHQDKLLVRPMGVERALVEEGGKKTFSPQERLTILSCRRLEKLYNVETLLRALARLKDRPDWQAVILGTGSQRRKLEHLAARRGIANRISFLGELSTADYRKVMLEADIYVSTSLSDSSSVSLLEAMASKLACVVTEIPGNSEWITVMENGLTYVPKSDEMLAFLVGKLLDDSELRLRLGERAFERVSARAVWEENMADVEEAFLKLAGKRQ
ncbi:MAG: glycosyltransferase [candidate division Zixibacteria bacterium]|nr:glycosyltransferase [candidate division Zixibacteria bacterium]MCI0595361.1 glycosyltransferase [candidate division Zixibacteria bacterium]